MMDITERVYENMNVENTEQDKKVEYLTTEPIPRLICKMSVPTIISMLVSTFYNMVDTIFVGKLNTQSTGAVGIAFSVMALLQAIGFFFGHGSGNYISRAFGAREYKKAEQMAATGFFSAITAGLVIAIVGFLFVSPVSVFLGSTPTILPYANDYLRVIFLGTPFIIGSFVLNNQMRFQGNASVAMIGIVSGAVFNIMLDPVLIFVFHMGITGAAVATVISQAVSFGILLVLNRKYAPIKVSVKNISFKGYYYGQMFKGGVPSLCRQGIGSVATICLNTAAGNYGGAAADAAIAAMGVVARITMFANSALIGFGQGFQPVCGTNYGAGQYGRVREAFWFCVKIGTIVLTCIAVVGFMTAEPLIQIFRSDADVVAIGSFAIRSQFIVMPTLAWTILCNMLLQTIGFALKASVVASARQGLFFIPLILILPVFMGLRGVQLAQMFADLLSFVLAIPMTLGVLNSFKKKDGLQ